MHTLAWRIALASVLAVATQAYAGTPCEELDLPLAQATRLKPFLEQLAAKRHFQLHYWTTDDPDIRVFGTADEVQLMTSLPSESNIVVKYSATPEGCGTGWRIKTVWVLPSGPANATRSSSPQGLSGLNDPTTRDYMRAHGMLVESP